MKKFQNILILLITAFTISLTGCDMNLISDDEDAKNKEQLLTLAAITLANQNRVTFTVTIDGVIQEVNLPALRTEVIDGGATGYNCLFFTENENYDYSDGSTISNSLSIILPLPVATGIYNPDSSTDFTVQYVKDNTEAWSVDSSYNFELNLTEWGGSGGRAKGTFYGTLYVASSNPTTITIANGSFDIAIE